MPSSARSRHWSKVPSRRWRRVRRLALERDDWRCTECGRVGRMEVHHVKALEHGGEPYALPNLASLCRNCHVRAHGGTVREDDPEYAVLVAELYSEKLDGQNS